MVQRLATEMYARGLSTRDIEDAFTRAGSLPAQSHKVSEVTFSGNKRLLQDLPLLCLFHGLYEPLRTHGITREAILCAWGITEGSDLSVSAVSWFVGLPTLTTDGAGGLTHWMNSPAVPKSDGNLLMIRDAPDRRPCASISKEFPGLANTEEREAPLAAQEVHQSDHAASSRRDAGPCLSLNR